MNIILDTCTFLYAASKNEKLSKIAVELLEDSSNCLFLSSISAYEIIVKYKLGKLELKVDPVKSIPEYRNSLGILELPVKEQEILFISELPDLHHDPFDRIIISQAMANDFVILTPDKLIHNYQLTKVIW